MGLDNTCPESLGDSTGSLKTVNYLEGDVPNIVTMYGSKDGEW